MMVAVPLDAGLNAMAASVCDVDGFAALYDRHAGQLYRYAYQRVGEHAQDVVADTFLAAFQQRATFDPDRSTDARAWLFGILTRKLARHHRAEQARFKAFARSATDDDEESPADQVAARVSASALRGRLAQALRRLSKGDRDVLLLIAWAECSYEEVAEALGIPLGTVRSRLNRARRKVRDELGGTDPTHDEGSMP
jgi:RNA polymerase sigma-70 factor (ECF subfamily)